MVRLEKTLSGNSERGLEEIPQMEKERGQDGKGKRGGHPKGEDLQMHQEKEMKWNYTALSHGKTTRMKKKETV